MSSQVRFLLNESDLPRFYYNIGADMPVDPAPVLRRPFCWVVELTFDSWAVIPRARRGGGARLVVGRGGA